MARTGQPSRERIASSQRTLAILDVLAEEGSLGTNEIARRLGLPLKVAAKIDDKDRDFYEQQLKPLFSEARVEFLGEIGECDKGGFLGDAAALLFPIDWPEPFGLVMIEAMACGTPVVAFRRGAVPEVMRDGVSGYVVDTLDGAVEATARALELPRKRCRTYFEGRFAAPRMANDYLTVYERLLAAGEQGHHPHRRLGLVPADADEADEPDDPASVDLDAGVEIA